MVNIINVKFNQVELYTIDGCTLQIVSADVEFQLKGLRGSITIETNEYLELSEIYYELKRYLKIDDKGRLTEEWVM